MTRKQRYKDITSLINHARMLLTTAAGLRPRGGEYRDDYLRWAEIALTRAAKQVTAIRNMGSTEKKT